MADLIAEPASTNPLTADWQALLSKLVKVCGGAEVCRLTNWDTTAEPQVAAGSRFEVNSSFFEVPSNESITGWSGISNGAVAYVYATPSGSTATFSYSSTAPTWDSAKGGWFNGTARALFRVLRTSATVWSEKRNMASIEDHDAIGTVKMFSGTFVNDVTMPGWYKCDGTNGTPNLVDKFIRGGSTSGATGGEDTHVLTVTEMPAHAHSTNIRPYGAYAATYALPVDTPSGQQFSVIQTSSAGGDQAHNNIPAYYALLFIMKTR